MFWQTYLKDWMGSTEVSCNGSKIISPWLASISVIKCLLGSPPLLYVQRPATITRFALTADQRPLRVEELRQALSLHHEIEGDTLLFEYADKDIELVCGSLVTVRQQTLQVIHLSVKEFLTNPQGRKSSTFSDLLIDSTKASLNLTLVCLKCIKDCCNESMVDIPPGTARLDIKLDDGAVTKRQRQAPLAEYASFTWMTHLTECDGVDMKRISKEFQKTFESPSTFCWVEACLMFQPDSVLRLLAGLEEAIEYISGLTPDHWPEREHSCVFFNDWCHALQCIFEEYGSILSHRPWEVHFLGLRKPFLGIGQLYKKYGDTPHRDIVRYIDGYRSPRSRRPKPRADQQLLQDPEHYTGQIYFIHDERRRLYFWGYYYINFNNTRLFVQNAATGQRLPPAVKLDGEADRNGTLVSYGLSPSGEYIVLVYNMYSIKSGIVEGSLTLIWQINEGLKFTSRLRSEPWARICFSHECKRGLFMRKVTSVVFLAGGYCLTPSGEIHLASNSRRPLSDLLPKHFDSANMGSVGSFFSPNGKYIFISKRLGVAAFQGMRLALFTETSEYLCSWKESRRKVVDVSPSGRFLVLSPDSSTILNRKGEETLYLYNVGTNETLLLPFSKEIAYDDPKFHFNEDEMELIMFTGTHFNSTMSVFVWSDLQLQPLLKSYGELKLEPGYIIRPAQIHINDDECTALMVSKNRVIQRVDFRTQVTFPDAPDVDDDYPCTTSQVSKDGVHWARLDYGQSKARFQMTDLSDARSSVYKLDLELSTSDDANLRAVAFSPNLGTLVVDAQIYRITKGRNGITLTSFTIQGLPDLIARHRSRSNSHLEYLISPCNSYFICFSPKDPDSGEAAPNIVYAFRVDLVSKSSTRLNLHLPEDLTFFSASFHPSQPLMLVTYTSSLGPSVQDWEKRQLAQVSIVELESLGMERADLPWSTPFTEHVKW